MAVELNENIHFVLNNSELTLNQEHLDGKEVENVFCNDGSRAILVDGQYFIAENQPVFLQEDGTSSQQYYIGENNHDFTVQDEEVSTSHLFTQTQLVEIVDEAGLTQSHQILYYTNENTNPEFISISEDVDAEDLQDGEGNFYSFKRIKLEGDLINHNEIVKNEDMVSNEQLITINQNCANYTSNEPEIIDLSKITGRNLITGQTVTLHSYMEKLKKRLNLEQNINNLNLTKAKHETVNNTSVLYSLLDKKISIGKTKSGKKIVGKIIHVGKKAKNQNLATSNEKNLVQEAFLIHNPSEGFAKNSQQTIKPKVLIKRVTISKDSFEEISKTLAGVMATGMAKEKLENTNIVVKLIEKKYCTENESIIKSTSYSYGYMEKECIQNEDETMIEKWRFVADNNKSNTLLDDHIYHDKSFQSENEAVDEMNPKFSATTSLTIFISYGKSGQRTIRVNLNPSSGNLCNICAKFFETIAQLRHHMNNVHNGPTISNICEICNKFFDNIQEHKEIHIKEGKLFVCTECDKNFTSQVKFNKHLSIHNVYLRPMECSVCNVRCANEWALKKHLITHTGIKSFSCNICEKLFFTQSDVNFHRKIHFPEKHYSCSICLRSFPRHSNLLRHQEIHKGSGILYKCDICGCSYNYPSSLTRHMVQNHLCLSDIK